MHDKHISLNTFNYDNNTGILETKNYWLDFFLSGQLFVRDICFELHAHISYDQDYPEFKIRFGFLWFHFSFGLVMLQKKEVAEWN